MKNDNLQMTKGMCTALLVLLLNVVGMTKMYAYDFSAVCETGQTLYYNITDATNHYVELTCPGEANSSNCWTGFTKPTGNIILPENVQYDGFTFSVTSIGNYAFNYCNGLTGSLTIPNSITSIGDYAFCCCQGFRGSLIIGNSVTSIGNNAFGGNLFTGSLTIPDSVTSIGDYAFIGSMDDLSFTGSLTIGNSVTTIGNAAFSSDNFTGSLTLGNSVTTIGDWAFANCDFTGTLTIPNSVTSIGDVAFVNCDFTGSLTISNSVTTIGNGAFSGCNGLTGSLIIGNSTATIGDYAFQYCSGLTSITVLVPTPPSVGTDVFNNVNPDIPVTVPCGCIPVYEASDWYNYFTTILEDCTAISEDDENTITIYPNPTNGQVEIEAEDFKHITISNMFGQVIYEGKTNGNTFEYDFSRRGEELYLVCVETSNGVVVKKVSVTR